MMSTKKKKKGPGRPKKQIIRRELAFEGIVSSPSNANCRDPRSMRTIEVYYQNPIMFNKIFSLFRSMNANNIKIRFEPTCIKMVTKGRLEKNTIYIKIFGNKLNRYYCEKPLEIGLDSMDMQKILKTLNKDHSRIDIISIRRTERSKMTIILYDDVMELEDFYEIDVSNIGDEQWDVEDEIELEKEYPIQFEIPFKLFKRKVGDFASLSNIMVFRKVGHGYLMMSHDFTTKRGKHNTIFRNGGKINLISSIEPDDMFFTSVKLSYIKPLATSLISDTLKISASKENKLIFTCYLDQKDDEEEKIKIPESETCRIKILTEIVDLKKEK